MQTKDPDAVGRREPSLSLVMPCYNEEDVVEASIRSLVEAFDSAGIPLELIAVENGSSDGTGAILGRLQKEIPAVSVVRVEENAGYGNGVLEGLPRCRAPWVGVIQADGQVDAADVLRLYESASTASTPVLAKARRRFRMDGFTRRVVSIAYNGFVWLLWPRLGSVDVNGLPKILPRAAVEAMRLESRRWFLDPEIMIKARHLGLRVIELNVFARMRGGGTSHVRAATCWEFFRSLLAYRFGRTIPRWKRSLGPDDLAWAEAWGSGRRRTEKKGPSRADSGRLKRVGG